jgi:hypothetical protein
MDTHSQCNLILRWHSIDQIFRVILKKRSEVTWQNTNLLSLDGVKHIFHKKKVRKCIIYGLTKDNLPKYMDWLARNLNKG